METQELSTAYLSTSGNDALTSVAANGICDLRRDVAKSEADIKEAVGRGFCETLKSIGDAECAISKNAMDIAHRSTIHLNSVERDIQNRVLENRQVFTAELNQLERSLSEKLCDIKSDGRENTRLILDRLTQDKLDEKNEIIDSLRHERAHDKYAHLFALQNQELSSLKQMINSVEQTQRFSSKTVQFGAGNVAIPTQTANQG